ncbi:MAG: hypothetical protein L6V93_05460 [Clostridiales bacterium]|nr:MAG: hypothetical protein L6V93_05460 [Clostridiales bacterium]
MSKTLIAPDFFQQAVSLFLDRTALDSIYKTGRGSVKVRAKYRYDKKKTRLSKFTKFHTAPQARRLSTRLSNL